MYVYWAKPMVKQLIFILTRRFISERYGHYFGIVGASTARPSQVITFSCGLRTLPPSEICASAFSRKIRNAGHSGVYEVFLFTKLHEWKEQRQQKWTTGKVLLETMRFWRLWLWFIMVKSSPQRAWRNHIYKAGSWVTYRHDSCIWLNGDRSYDKISSSIMQRCT